MIGRVAQLCRHPVKGFTPERLAAVDLRANAYFPYDRIYAVERGRSGFDPLAPKHLSKWRFAVLANHARLARARTRYDEASSRLRVVLDGEAALDAELATAEGRQAFADWLAGFLGEHEDETLQVVACGSAHRFTDDDEGFISVINLQSVRALEALVGRPVDPLRMRANIYVEGWPAWAELKAAAGAPLRFGGVETQAIKPIPRCIATHVDPVTGERDLDLVPLLRRHFGHVNCGLYLQVTGGGRVAEGDAAQLL